MISGPKKNRLVFFGNERLVSGLESTDTPILRGLIEHGYDIAAIVAHHSDGTSRRGRPLEVAEVAREHSIPLLTPDRPSDIANELTSLESEAAVLVAYGRIVPQSVIDIFPKGIINVHPSLLPRYRGPTPLESPIISGDTESGVSIMQLSSKMDAGPVYAQQTIPVEETDTKFDLYRKASDTSCSLLLRTLPQILNGSLNATPQNDADASYCSLLSKQDGMLDPLTQTAVDAERRVRAYLGFPKSRLTVRQYPIIVTKAHVTTEQKTPLDVMFSDGNYLSIDELVAPSGKHMDAAAFLRGYAAS